MKSLRSQSIHSKLYLRWFTSTGLMTINILVTYLRLHSFIKQFALTDFDMHRFTTLAEKHKGTMRESRDATNTIAGYRWGTITSQVCSVSYLVYLGGCNRL